MIEYKYRNRKKYKIILGLSVGVIAIIMVVGLINRKLNYDPFEENIGSREISTFDRKCLVYGADDNVKEEIINNWNSLSDSDKVLYGYTLHQPNKIVKDLHIFKGKGDNIKELNEECTNIVNCVKALDLISKNNGFIYDSYITRDKVEAMKYYLNELDSAYKRLKQVGYPQGYTVKVDLIEQARLHEMNKVYPLGTRALSHVNSKNYKEEFINNLSKQIAYWRGIL